MGSDIGEERPLFKGKLSCSMNGFSQPGARAKNTLNRRGLEQLISCIARGPFSNDRITLCPEGGQLALKRPFADGTTHILMSCGELIEKLTALIPPPRSHLVRWSGSFAPNSKYRRKIVLNPDEKKGFDFEGKKRGKIYRWADLLARVFGIDVLLCPCGGGYVAKGAIKQGSEIRRYLTHIGLDPIPPARGPPDAMVYQLDFEGIGESEDVPTIDID